jgi:hypothetical protein
MSNHSLTPAGRDAFHRVPFRCRDRDAVERVLTAHFRDAVERVSTT